ncbi:MAG: permease prefix domain 1-containing protein [Coriobacteriia bacterium]|nr:permease prefix domain 1-containing protein [Coriobacteriia bacterium]
MNNVETYVAGVFAGITDTPEVIEQKQELAADLAAHIEDLVKEGTSEAAAFGIATSSMGPLDDLLEEYRSIQQKAEEEAQRNLKQMQRALALPEFRQVKKAALDLHTMAGASVVGIAGSILVVLIFNYVGGMLGEILPGLMVSLVAAFLLIGVFLFRWHKARNKRFDIRYDLSHQSLIRFLAALTILLACFVVGVPMGFYLIPLIAFFLGIAAFLISEPLIRSKLLKRGWFQPHPENEAEAEWNEAERY